MLIAQEICNRLSDEEIVGKALKDVDYFSCLYQRYEARLLRYIQRISKVTREDAEDILQESFLKVWKGLYSFDSGLKLSSWLYRIVHNEVISSWRKNHGITQDSLTEWRATDVQTAGESGDSAGEDEEKIRQAIAGLPEKYRTVLVLKYLEEMSYEEISDVLKIPEGTVATRLNRARKALGITVEET